MKMLFWLLCPKAAIKLAPSQNGYLSLRSSFPFLFLMQSESKNKPQLCNKSCWDPVGKTATSAHCWVKESLEDGMNRLDLSCSGGSIQGIGENIRRTLLDQSKDPCSPASNQDQPIFPWKIKTWRQQNQPPFAIWPCIMPLNIDFLSFSLSEKC